MANSFKLSLAGPSLDARCSQPHQAHMPIYLREWRKAAGLTLEQAGNRLGVHLSTLQKWERDVNGVDTREIERLGRLYGVHPSALFYPPEDAGDAERLGRAYKVLRHMPRDKVDSWLAFGETFVIEPSANDASPEK